MSFTTTIVVFLEELLKCFKSFHSERQIKIQKCQTPQHTFLKAAEEMTVTSVRLKAGGNLSQ